LNELQITEGALYPLLHKLESDGILETEIEYIGNRIRKYYTLTKVGKKQSIIVAKEMDLFLQSLKNILQPTLAKS
jgi:PadR family transcriptional regulator PadR